MNLLATLTTIWRGRTSLVTQLCVWYDC